MNEPSLVRLAERCSCGATFVWNSQGPTAAEDCGAAAEHWRETHLHTPPTRHQIINVPYRGTAT